MWQKVKEPCESVNKHVFKFNTFTYTRTHTNGVMHTHTCIQVLKNLRVNARYCKHWMEGLFTFTRSGAKIPVIGSRLVARAFSAWRAVYGVNLPYIKQLILLLLYSYVWFCCDNVKKSDKWHLFWVWHEMIERNRR